MRWLMLPAYSKTLSTAVLFQLPHRPLRCLGLLLLVSLGLAGCASSQSVDRTYTPPGPIENPQDAAAADQLWQVFERYQGTPYEYGGMSDDGFDCSGFIVTAYQEALGRQLPRTTGMMLRAGIPVDRRQVRPGDLVFFTIEGKEQHAGIYMGDNRFIHASSSIGVTQSQLNGYYWRDRFTQVRRFE
ncbi:C40 family peptidase [Marinobacter sp. 1Y8]